MIIVIKFWMVITTVTFIQTWMVIIIQLCCEVTTIPFITMWITSVMHAILPKYSGSTPPPPQKKRCYDAPKLTCMQC